MPTAAQDRVVRSPPAPAFRAFFLDVADGAPASRFVIYHPAHLDKPIGRIVFVHALAEEMNKSRRMAALQSRALAAAGLDVLQIDLTGCGDSAGDFSQATWNAWVNDVMDAVAWLRDSGRSSADDGLPEVPMWLWGHRAGCLVATEAARRLEVPVSLLFWNPMSSGKLALQQFLRLRVAGDMLASGAKGVMDELKKELKEGRPVDVAGYLLNPALAAGLDRATLAPPSKTASVVWLEVSPQADAATSPAVMSAAMQWKGAGWEVRTEAVTGPSFWQTTEIEDAPLLLAATTQQVCRSCDVSGVLSS